MSRTAAHNTEGQDQTLSIINGLAMLDLKSLSFLQLKHLQKALRHAAEDIEKAWTPPRVLRLWCRGLCSYPYKFCTVAAAFPPIPPSTSERYGPTPPYAYTPFSVLPIVTTQDACSFMRLMHAP